MTLMPFGAKKHIWRGDGLEFCGRQVAMTLMPFGALKLFFKNHCPYHQDC